jgi:hypothetical protein
MKTYKIRVTGDVLSTSTATRRCVVAGHVLTFGREPVYLRAAKLPPELADDRHLRIETVDTAPSGVPVINLKAERVEEQIVAPSGGPVTNLKAERVEEEIVAPSGGPVTDLKAERVEEESVAPPIDEATLESVPAQVPTRKRR